MNIHAIATMHRREMNHTEEKYAKLLDEQLTIGEIRWWGFEEWKFRLADNTWYTPDFIVVDNELRIEAHEIKAEWSPGKTGWKDDARVKIKVVADKHPIRFIAVTLCRNGIWEFEEFLKEQEEAKPMSFAEAMDRLGEVLNCPRSLDGIITEIIRLQSAVHNARG